MKAIEKKNLKYFSKGVSLLPAVVKTYNSIGLKLNPAKNESCVLLHLISAEQSCCNI